MLSWNNDGTKHVSELSDTVPGILQSKHFCLFGQYICNVLSSCSLGGTSVVCGFLAAHAQAMRCKQPYFFTNRSALQSLVCTASYLLPNSFSFHMHLLPGPAIFFAGASLHAIWSALGHATPLHRFLLLMHPIGLRQLEYIISGRQHHVPRTAPIQKTGINTYKNPGS